MFCNGKHSNTIVLDIGVPQGSTLGPFLFLAFINDLSQAISDGYNNMFADNVCLYTIRKSVSEAQMSFQKCVTNADEWYVSNLLSVNSTKSFVMLVGSQQAIHTNTSEFAIYLNNDRLEEVKCATYFGLEIDSLLKWDVHIKMLTSIISMNLAIFSRSSSFLNQNKLCKIYKTTVQPSIDYALSIWGNCNEYNKNMIFKLKKRAAWIVTGNFDFINVRGQDIMNELGGKLWNKDKNIIFHI